MCHTTLARSFYLVPSRMLSSTISILTVLSKDCHHAIDIPVKPPPDGTAREHRFYKRNLAKYEQKIEADYNKYRAAFQTQQTLLNEAGFYAELSCIANFPKLETLHLTTSTRCNHALSRRYQEAFPLSCALPGELCSFPSIIQLRSLLLCRPGGLPLLGLQNLTVHALSPLFFKKSQPHRQHVQDVFASLKSIKLVFRLHIDQRDVIDHLGVQKAYQSLSKGFLAQALAGAKDVKTITINFDDFGYFGPTVKMQNVLGDIAWPELISLDLECIQFTEDEIIRILKRQSKLKVLQLAFACLEGSTWKELLRELKELALMAFQATGVLEDDRGVYPTGNIDAHLYQTKHVEMTLGEKLDKFVTGALLNEDSSPVAADFCPLEDIDWQDPGELYLMYGHPVETDYDMDDDSLDEVQSESESDLPGLATMDVD